MTPNTIQQKQPHIFVKDTLQQLTEVSGWLSLRLTDSAGHGGEEVAPRNSGAASQ